MLKNLLEKSLRFFMWWTGGTRIYCQFGQGIRDKILYEIYSCKHQLENKHLNVLGLNSTNKGRIVAPGSSIPDYYLTRV